MFSFDKQKLIEQRILDLRRELEENLELHAALKEKHKKSPRIRMKSSFSDLMWKILARS
jgi:hypothetical protein